MEIIKVTSKKEEQDFIKFQHYLYKDNPHYIRPLNKEIKYIFDHTKNFYCTKDNHVRFILKDKEGKIIGRIAAFINNIQPTEGSLNTGSIGFFDCIDDKEAASMLFSTCEEWLAKREKNYITGSVNLGNRLSWWGILTKGFEYSPSYGMNYNFPYYSKLFESYGFEKDYDQYILYRRIEKSFSSKFNEKSDRILQREGYEIKSITMKDLDKHIEEFRYVYNLAWKNLLKLKDDMTKEQARKIVGKLKSIIDPRIIYFAYFKNKPIGFLICMPDINKALKNSSGVMNIFTLAKIYLVTKI